MEITNPAGHYYSNGRFYRFKNSRGILEYYKHYKEKFQKDAVSLHTYRIIIRSVNKKVGEALLNESVVALPFGMGVLALRRKNPQPVKKDGKYVVNTVVNWQRTKKLWEEDEDAKKRKVLVWADLVPIVIPHHSYIGRKIVNQSLFRLRFNRALYRKIVTASREGKLKTYIN